VRVKDVGRTPWLVAYRKHLLVPAYAARLSVEGTHFGAGIGSADDEGVDSIPVEW
jgi:hypothetical protein